MERLIVFDDTLLGILGLLCFCSGFGVSSILHFSFKYARSIRLVKRPGEVKDENR